MRQSSSAAPLWAWVLHGVAALGIVLVVAFSLWGNDVVAEGGPPRVVPAAINLDPVTPPPATAAAGVILADDEAENSQFTGVQRGSSANCNRTALHGILHDGVNALNGLSVRVWREGDERELQSAPSGTINTLDDGGYEILLDNRPLSGWWIASVVDEQGRPFGSSVAFLTDTHDCEGSGQQLIRIDFQRMKGAVGTAGKPLTALSQQVLTLEVPAQATVVEATPLPDGLRWDGQARQLDVPILMYHYISAAPPDADRYRRDLSVGPDLFRSHLVTLREQGYTTITLSQLAEALATGTPLPPKPIVLTFDDGYLDNYQNAFPIMQQEGAVGTFFLVTDLLEQRHPLYMSWEQAAEMAATGMEMSSHTTGHADLTTLSRDDAWWQLSRSRALLVEKLGVEATTLGYPFGKLNDQVAALARDAGYAVAVTTAGGTTADSTTMMTLPRVRVHGGDFAEAVLSQIDYWRGR